MSRHFRLEEARALLPAVGRVIRDAVAAKARFRDAREKLEALSQRIMMRGGVAVDVGTVENLKTQRETGEKILRDSLGSLEGMSVLVKDLDTGLIDFPTLYEGQEVLLCWRMDEADINYWHDLESGFRGRRLIDQHFLDNHRGD
jgi:hypothetical protein